MAVLSDWVSGAGKRVLVLMDRQNLVLQTYARFLEYFPALGFRVGVACKTVSERIDYDADILIASRQTLAPRIADLLRTGRIKPFNAVIIDECHNVLIFNPNLINVPCGTIKKPENQYFTIIQALREAHPTTRIFGFTATPYRFSGEIYGENKLFSAVDYRITTAELIRRGMLTPMKWKVSQSDISEKLKNVRRASTGELNEYQHQDILTQPCYLKECLRAYQEHCSDRKTVIFGLNIAHADMLILLFLHCLLLLKSFVLNFF